MFDNSRKNSELNNSIHNKKTAQEFARWPWGENQKEDGELPHISTP